MALARISRPLGELTRLSSAFVSPFGIVTPMTLVAPERRVLLSPAVVGARFFAPATLVAPALVFVAAAFRDFEAVRTLDFVSGSGSRPIRRARDRIEPVRAARFSDRGSLSVGAFSRGPCTRPDRHRSPSRSPRPLDPASASLRFRRQSCLLREFGGRADVRVRIRVQCGEARVFRLSRILVRNAPAILHVATLAASPPERYVVEEGNEKWLRLPDQSRECERLRNREMQRLRRREQVP